MERVRIGDYRLEAELTASTAARMYRATHQVLPRQAMIKIACEPAGSVAVLREACILAALPHCGIVRVYEVGRLGDHRTWFASEIVDGLTVAGMLELGALDPMTVIAIVRDAADILAHAHQRGIVHGASAVRIRKPRWTPPLSFGSEDAAEALLDAAPTLDDITKRE